MTATVQSRSTVQLVGLVLGPILFFATLSLNLDPEVPLVTSMAAVAVLMAVWWVTEAIPLAATSMLPIVLFPLLGIMTPKATAPLYFNSTIFLFIGGFIIALAMEKWNLHKRIALLVIRTVGGGPARLVMGFMAASAFLSMWISNTATTVMMLPVGLSIILKMEEEFGKSDSHKFSVALMLGIAYAASMGGMATLVGTPPNLVFQRVFELSFPEGPGVSFGNWFIMALPLSLAMILVTWLVLTKVLYRPAAHLKVDREIVKQEYKELGKTSFEERVVLTVFIITALLWVFRKDITLGGFTIPGWSNLLGDISVDDGTVAMIMAMLLFFIPTRSPEARSKSSTLVDVTVFRSLPWAVIILFGGGFALAKGFQVSGLADYLGGQLAGLAVFSPLVMVGMINLSMTFMTELTSNTATTQMILPILGSLAVAIGENPLLLMIPATLSASCAFMMPVATPPNAIVFGSERVRIGEMVRAGLFLNFIGIVLVTGIFFLWGTIVFDITPGVQPEWAKLTPAEPEPETIAPTSDDQPPVVIGVPLPLSGNSSETALMMKNSFAMAAERINAEGGINGRPVLLVYGDNEENPDNARALVEDLAVNAKAVMLVGGFRSDPTYAMSSESNIRDLPFLISTAAADRITQAGWRNVYRLSPPVSEYTTSLEDLWQKEVRPKSVAIVHESTILGIDGATSMLEFLGNNGIESSTLIQYDPGSVPSQLRATLSPLAESPPDIIYMIASLSDSIVLVQTIRELGIESDFSGGAFGFAHPDFVTAAGEAANGLTTASLWSSQLPYSGAQEYYDQYVETYSAIPDYHGAEAYSALLVAADALVRAESFSPADIRTALNNTVMDTPFGPVKFASYDEFERQNGVRTQVLQIQDGNFEVVWPLDILTAPYVP
ncbi:MAG: DASS family sodium-coupled anion symporter [Chloroflexi bacterium]|nr:DASS family sodium-coupled anion symporter [Chloroflexota bacterium]